MANALHFQRDAAKDRVLGQNLDYLRPGGRFILVEYNVDRGNMWVPSPCPTKPGKPLPHVTIFGILVCWLPVPSRFLGAIYSALSLKADL